jgi:hypothetical protein
LNKECEMSHPEWLNQVQEIKAPTAGADGKSETGLVLGAIADALQAEGAERFAAGDVLGVVIRRSAGAQYAVAVSTGNARADIARLALQHGAPLGDVSLVPAAVMITEQFQGAAACLPVPAAPVDVDARVTIDQLQYQLDKKKAEGVPGTTIVAVSGRDNNARAGVANFEVLPRLVGVAKAEFDKPWSQAKFVSRGGVPVLVLG